MYLKCFGGPFDQERQDVPDNRCKQGEYWAINSQTKMSAHNFGPNKMPEMATIERHVYIVETMRCKEIRFIFLRYEPVVIEEIFAKIFI